MLAVSKKVFTVSTQHGRGAGSAGMSRAAGLQLTLVLPRIIIAKARLLIKAFEKCCEFPVCVLEVSAVWFGGLDY